MQAKLTLRLEGAAIRKAKRVAKHHGQSVSKLFESCIEALPDRQTENLPPVTASMLGAIKTEGANIDEQDYRAHLESKYL